MPDSFSDLESQRGVLVEKLQQEHKLRGVSLWFAFKKWPSPGPYLRGFCGMQIQAQGPFIWRTWQPKQSLQWLGIRTPFMYQPDRLPDYD